MRNSLREPKNVVNYRETGPISYLRQIWELLKETYSEWSRDNASQLGAALAFYTIFSLAPVFIIITVVIGYILGKESVYNYIITGLSGLIDNYNAVNIMNIIQNYYKPGSGIKSTIIAIILIIVGSTTVFLMLRNALNFIWGVTYRHDNFIQIIKKRMISFLIVLLFGVILFISMITSSMLAALNNFISAFFVIPVYFFQTADFILSIIILSVMFAIIYKILPDVNISWSDVWIGSAITAILFTLGKFLFSLYLARSTISSAYGAAGSLVVVLLWVYYSAQVIFIGAEFTQVYARRYGSGIAPKNPRDEK